MVTLDHHEGKPCGRLRTSSRPRRSLTRPSHGLRARTSSAHRSPVPGDPARTFPPVRAFSPVADPRYEARPAVRDSAALPGHVLFHGVTPARGRRGWSLLLDLVVVLTTFVLGAQLALAAGVGAACLTWLALCVDFARHGRTAGHRAFGLRTVDRRTALPGGLASVLPGRGTTADLRGGRDPLRLIPMTLAPVPGAVDPWRVDAAPARPVASVLVCDDGSVLTIIEPTIVGRRPADPAGSRRLLGITDLSRSISRSHALLEPDGSLLWVTDLGSANGTAVAPPGAPFAPLASHVRTAAPVGSRLALGDRLLHLADPRHVQEMA